ncbi:benzoate 4-monooxygenase cytochrome P450 [Aspergillus pseudoustus]|uniref:Benzoate 4-monooxygenase cytochrome P450 n=1 Tax=Aspergillus pseudoustus TaxID=1810923 RepID=A0ABR4J998_9EURO
MPLATLEIQSHGTPCRKEDIYVVTAGSHAHVLNAVDRDEHARKRRTLSHAFSTKNLALWEYKIAEKVSTLLRVFDRGCISMPIPTPADTIDFTRWANLFTIDAIADLALSEKLHLLDKGTEVIATVQTRTEYGGGLGFIESMHAGNYISSVFAGATEWFTLLKLLTGFIAPMRAQWEHGKNFGRIVSDLTENRLERYRQEEHLNDLFTSLLEDKKGNPRGIEMGQLEAEATVLLDAGSDTTAIALTHALYYLIKNPKVLATVRRELQTVTSDEPIARYDSVKNLPYLKACPEESLRISPPLARGPERRTPPEGMKIMGEDIAGDVVVSVPTYVAHRDPTVFEDPEIYRPERWLEGEGKSKAMREAFILLTAGARGCLGRNITMMEQKILIATLVHRYDFALLSEDWCLQYNEAFLLWPGTMPVRIWRRGLETAT